MKFNKILTKIKNIKWGGYPLTVIGLFFCFGAVGILLNIYFSFGDVETFNEVRKSFVGR